jgi:hypothetical protein
MAVVDIGETVDPDIRACRHHDTVSDEPEPATAQSLDTELTVVMLMMVAFAEQDEVVHIGAAAVQPMPDVVGLDVLPIAARVSAAAVAISQRAELSLSHQSMRTSHIQRCSDPTVSPFEDEPDATGARQAFDNIDRQSGTVLDVSDRLAWFT